MADSKKDVLNWLSDQFGGGLGEVVKAKKTRKAQLEKAHKAAQPKKAPIKRKN